MNTLRALVLLFLFLAACVPRPKLLLTPDQLARHQEIIDRIDERAERIKTLSATARVLVRNEKFRLSQNLFVRLESPDRLRMESHDPLGGLQMLLVAGDDQGLIVVPTAGRRIPFSPAKENLKRYLGVDLTVPDLVRLLAGGPPVPLAPDRLRSDTEAGETVFSVLEKGKWREKVWLGDGGSILRWDRLNGEGKAEESIHFDDFREVEGIPIPFAIRFVQPENGAELIVRYQTIFLNQPLEQNLFELPELPDEGLIR